MRKILKICLLLLLLAALSAPQPAFAAGHKESLKKDSSLGPGYYSVRSSNSYKSKAYRMPRATDTAGFLNSIKTGAINGWNKYKVLPSITAAQGVLESGWGSSQLTKVANNLFGIKGRYNGKYVLMPTQEYINGEWVTVNAEFRKYPSRHESMEDHGEFLSSKPRYANLIGKTNYKEVANLLYQDGYATDPQYAQKLISIIEKYKLQEWDPSSRGEGKVANIAPLLLKPQFKGQTPIRKWSNGTNIQVYKYTDYWYKAYVKENGVWTEGYIYSGFLTNLKPVSSTPNKYTATIKAFMFAWDNTNLVGGKLKIYKPGASLIYYKRNDGLLGLYYPSENKWFYTMPYWIIPQ